MNRVADQIEAVAHRWAIAAYNKALGLDFEDIDTIKAELRALSTPIAEAKLEDWRTEIGHPNNRMLFKRMVEKAGIDLANDDIASGLEKVAALSTAGAAEAVAWAHGARIQGMVRSLTQWETMVPDAVMAGSPAQVHYALVDAKHDIAALAHALFASPPSDTEDPRS